VRAIRANPAVMFGLSALVVTIGVALSALVTWYLSAILTGQFSDFLGDLGASGADVGVLDQQFGSVIAQYASLPITAVATTILTGLLVVSVSRSVLGQKISVREVLRSSRVWWVVGYTVALSVAQLVVIGAWFALVWWLATSEMVGATVAVVLLGGLALVVGGVWLTVRLLLVTPALMLEGKGFATSIARAWRLTRGSFWRLLGIYVLVLIITSIISQVVVVPFAVGAGLTGGLGSMTTGLPLLLTSLGQAVALTVTTTYTAAVVALLYIDVRMRREGLDVELGRAATAAQDATA
jgi:hypothetical protein